MAETDQGQRYYRVTLILGDRDPDLREWCRANQKACTSVIREALRTWLQAHPEAGDEQPARRVRQKRPRPGAPSATPVGSGAAPPNHTLPLPPSPAPPLPVVEPPAVVVDPSPEALPPPASEAAVGVPATDRAKLQRLFSANRDFR
jgi:hypothetical protein